MMKKISLVMCAVIAVAFTVSCVSCGKNHQTPPPLVPSEPDVPENQEDNKTKEVPVIMWMDAEANFERFSTKEGITNCLDRIADTGFNEIVVDVKPVEGDALYDSSILPHAKTIGSVTVNRDWDYLRFFIDEAHKRGLKVTASTTVFTLGTPHNRQGPVYRDVSKWAGKTCVEYTPQGMVDIKDDAGKVGAFLNPAREDVQEFALSFIREITSNYDIDGYALDYCRYCGAESDFSDYSKTAFETFLGKKITDWPSDVFTYNSNGGRVPGPYYKQWWEWRSTVIRDFVAMAGKEIHAIKPEVRLMYWAASWWGALYQNGQNWGSSDFMPLSDIEGSNYGSWCSQTYNNTGFAGELDLFLLGSYLPKVYGAADGESIEYAFGRARRIILKSCDWIGSFSVSDPEINVKDAAYYCMKASGGVMVFDVVNVINRNKWNDLKVGISRARAEMEK